jgi:diguanylate cyclase (GGDEF)-like protein
MPFLTLTRLLRTHRRTIALWALVSTMAFAALAVLWALDAPPPRSRIDLPWWVLVIALAVTERCTVHVHFRRSTHALTLGEIPLVIALAFDGPHRVAFAWTIALLIVLLPTRPVPVRLAYNLANMLLVIALVALALQTLPTGGAALWAAVAVGVLAASAVTAPVLSLAMALSGERMGLRRIRTMMGMGILVSMTNASLALAAVAVLEAEPSAGLLLLAPAGIIFLAYRAYTQQRRQHLELEFLYDASRTLSRADDRAAGLAGVLAVALETFRAEIAEICMLPAESGGEGTRITVGPDNRVEVLEAVPPAVVSDLRHLVEGKAGARVLADHDRGGALGARLESMGLQETMVAALPGDSGLMGTMMVANRRQAGGFAAPDRRLFETLAAHTGAALSQDRLERRVLELRETKDQLYHQAFHDALTGLANRLLFADRVAHALARRSGNVIVIYIDLDDFKPVNDTYGHEAGDVLLCAVAERLRDSLRPADTPARLGGDEFAVLLTDVAVADVSTIADRIMRNFGAAVDLGDATIGIAASMGIAIADSGSMPADELLRKADAAMYVAKRGGKRGYALYEQEAVAAAV